MNDVVIGGVALLFAVSCVVRILPSVIGIALSARQREKIQSILPVAVFVNLLVYCVVSESTEHRVASLASFAVAALVCILTIRRPNLLLTVASASALYLVLR